MARKILFLSLMFTLVAGCALTIAGQGSEKDRPAPGKRIEYLVKRAQARGERTVRIVSPEVDYRGGGSGLDEALLHFGVVLARVIEQKSFIMDGDRVESWYRLQVVDRLSDPHPGNRSSFHSSRPPDTHYKRGLDEILIGLPGGKVKVEGVEVTQTNHDYPDLIPGRMYLIFTDLDATGVGFVGGGPNGLFEVAASGLVTQMGREGGRIGLDLKSRFGNSVPKFKASLAAQVAP
jgi:hypothetical protein